MNITTVRIGRAQEQQQRPHIGVDQFVVRRDKKLCLWKGQNAAKVNQGINSLRGQVTQGFLERPAAAWLGASNPHRRPRQVC